MTRPFFSNAVTKKNTRIYLRRSEFFVKIHFFWGGGGGGGGWGEVGSGVGGVRVDVNGDVNFF